MVTSAEKFTPLKAPFPWFGGKSRARHLIWQAIGDVPNYVEPFFGSGAVLFGREGYDPYRHTETVNDFDCYLANFWRALQTDPEAIAYWADAPVSEADLHARHLWLVNQAEFRERMQTDPDYCDFKIAGWWVWGVCSWIGSGWCKVPKAAEGGLMGDGGRGVHRQLPHLGDGGMGVHRKLPHLGNGGRGVHRQLPHLGNGGRGVHRQLPHLGNGGMGGASAASRNLYAYFDALAVRLRRVRVCCGDWSRVVTPSVTEKHGVTGVFLDPPYEQSMRCKDLYAVETRVSGQVREWAIANGDNPKLRIVLCGYEGEHEMPDSWQCVAWKAAKGYAAQGKTGNENRKKERLWLSPHCLEVDG